MSPARKAFLIIFGLSLVFGLGLGLVNFVAPDAISVSLNDENVEGMTAFWTALISSAIPGLIFGLICAGITALVTRGRKKAEPGT